jgi:hypothetical protein
VVIAIAGLFAGALDPLANWATFAVFDPRMLHFPFSWPYVDIAPNLEPALSFLGGYAAYYLLNGLGMLAAHNRLVAPLLRRTGWLAGRPLCGGIPPEITRPYLRRVADAGQLAEAG